MIIMRYIKCDISSSSDVHALVANTFWTHELLVIIMCYIKCDISSSSDVHALVANTWTHELLMIIMCYIKCDILSSSDAHALVANTWTHELLMIIMRYIKCDILSSSNVHALMYPFCSLCSSCLLVGCGVYMVMLCFFIGCRRCISYLPLFNHIGWATKAAQASTKKWILNTFKLVYVQDLLWNK